MPEIIGIACVYGVTVGQAELQELKEGCAIDDHSQLVKFLTAKGLSLYTHPDWEDMFILGTTVVSLDVDPSLTGSRFAPVITVPDVIDFTEYTDERPMYYQVPIMEI